LVDINRRGRKSSRFTLQLRNKRFRDSPLLRLDILGADHPNPPGNYPLAGELIPCPHLHIAHPEYGDSIAYPLNSEYAKIYLTDDELEDLVVILKRFLERCNVTNLSDFKFSQQTELF
jgi:hypothetical protein